MPQGMEEGTECEVPSADIGLIVGQPARFRFFGSTVRPDDKPGALLPSCSSDELVETNSLETKLKSEADGAAGFSSVPVRFCSRVTELGVLELWCVSTTDDRRWKLEFDVRESQ